MGYTDSLSVVTSGVVEVRAHSITTTIQVFEVKTNSPATTGFEITKGGGSPIPYGKGDVYTFSKGSGQPYLPGDLAGYIKAIDADATFSQDESGY